MCLCVQGGKVIQTSVYDLFHLVLKLENLCLTYLGEIMAHGQAIPMEKALSAWLPNWKPSSCRA